MDFSIFDLILPVFPMSRRFKPTGGVRVSQARGILNRLCDGVVRLLRCPGRQYSFPRNFFYKIAEFTGFVALRAVFAGIHRAERRCRKMRYSGFSATLRAVVLFVRTD